MLNRIILSYFIAQDSLYKYFKSTREEKFFQC